jgi:ABC-type oligopeptide transport system substrate-binding subunit
MRFILLTLASLALASCVNNTTAERRPVPPQGSDESSIPWNAPRQGEGAGMLGGLLEGR